jgi:hypothetical protein
MMRVIVMKGHHVPSSLVLRIINFMMGGRARSMDGVSMFIGDYNKPQLREYLICNGLVLE